MRDACPDTLDLVLQLDPDQIDEALRLSGPYGNMIPGIRYLHEQMRPRWDLKDAMLAFEWLQETERMLADRPDPTTDDVGGEG